MRPPLEIAIDGHVATIIMLRSEKRNILDDELIDKLLEALDTIERNKDVRCIVLTGCDGAFCSGGNFKEIHERRGFASGSPAQIQAAMVEKFQRLPKRFARLELPIIAAIDGPAIGGGLDLSLMCDIRVASTRAVFAESFVKLGLLSADGGAWFLARIVGVARALELSLTGDQFSAEVALSYGVISGIYESNALLTQATHLARRISTNSRHAIRQTKLLVLHAAKSSLDENLSLAAAMQGIAYHTKDHREAVAAISERRQALFSDP